MKRLSILLLLLLTACGASYEPQSYPTSLPSNTAEPTFTQTATIEPTPTTGYQATAEIALQTAEAAIRLNVAVTAEAEQRIHQEMAWTAEANVREQEVLGWTATAASTSIGLTATQQAALNTQIPAQQALLAGQLTSTAQAPTLMVAMRDAELQVKYAPVKIFGIVFAVGCHGLFLLCCSVVMLRDDRRKREKTFGEASQQVPQAAPQAAQAAAVDYPIIHPVDQVLETVVQLTKDNGSGFTSTSRMVVPCSAEQLTELADGLINGRKTLAFNQWEGKSSQYFTRPVFQQVRGFLQINKLAKAAAGASNLILTDEGEAFMRGYLNTSSLPSSYEFSHEAADLQGESTHEHENHAHDHTQGEVKTPLQHLTALSVGSRQVQQRRRLI